MGERRDTFWTGHVSVPNPHYFCVDCGRDLWDKRRRLRNPLTCPTINVSDDKMLCNRCYYRKEATHAE